LAGCFCEDQLLGAAARGPAIGANAAMNPTGLAGVERAGEQRKSPVLAAIASWALPPDGLPGTRRDAWECPHRLPVSGNRES
jgi:hypothetical protein